MPHFLVKYNISANAVGFHLTYLASFFFKVADTNFQKFIGCIPDTIGVMTQAQALALFAAGCAEGMPEKDNLGNPINYTVGPGYWCYVFCWFAAVVRVSMHYLTPVPGGGAGCKLEDLEGVAKSAKLAAAIAASRAEQAAAEAAVLAGKGTEKGALIAAGGATKAAAFLGMLGRRTRRALNRNSPIGPQENTSNETPRKGPFGRQEENSNGESLENLIGPREDMSHVASLNGPTEPRDDKPIGTSLDP